MEENGHVREKRMHGQKGEEKEGFMTSLNLA